MAETLRVTLNCDMISGCLDILTTDEGDLIIRGHDNSLVRPWPEGPPAFTRHNSRNAVRNVTLGEVDSGGE